MKKLEFYYFMESAVSISDPKTSRTYYVNPLNDSAGASLFDSTRKIAEFFLDELKSYDHIVLYESLDQEVEGRPRLVVVRSGDSCVRGPPSQLGILLEIQRQMKSISSARHTPAGA